MRDVQSPINRTRNDMLETSPDHPKPPQPKDDVHSSSNKYENMNISESDYTLWVKTLEIYNEAQKGNVPLNEPEADYESVDIGDQQNK